MSNMQDVWSTVRSIAIAHFDRAPVGVELVDFYDEEMVLIVSAGCG